MAIPKRRRGWGQDGESREPPDKYFSTQNISKPINVIEGHIKGFEIDGRTEAWRLHQAGLTMLENEDGNAIEWRRNAFDDVLAARIYEIGDGTDVNFEIDITGEILTNGAGTISTWTTRNSAIVDSNTSQVATAATALHNSSPTYSVTLKRGATTTRAWEATNVSGTLKQAWFGATPVAKAGSTSDLKDCLVNYGLLTDGGATPLNLDGGALTIGSIVAPTWKPASDSTTALQMQTSGGTMVAQVDTSNQRFGVGTVQTARFWVFGRADEEQMLVKAHSTQNQNIARWVGSDGVDKVIIRNDGVFKFSTRFLVRNSADSVDIGEFYNAGSGGAYDITLNASQSSGFVQISNAGTAVARLGYNDGGGSYGIAIGRTNTNRSGLCVTPFLTTDAGVMIMEPSSYSGNAFEARNSSNVAVWYVTAGGGFVANEQGDDVDSRIEGDTDANLTFWDASTDRVGIGTATPSYKLDVAGGVNVSSGNVYRVNGTQVVAAQGAAVSDASGGATIDSEARTAINTLLARLRTHGLIAT